MENRLPVRESGRMFAGMKHVAWIVSAAAAVMIGGCETVSNVTDSIGEGIVGAVNFKGEATPVSSEPIDLSDGWPFAPASMRVHPFTSIGIDPKEGMLTLEARIEMLDPLGDATKGVGQFRFELYADQNTASRKGQDQQLNLWNAPLATLEENTQHYDPITRTYLFKLRLDPAPPQNQRLKLVVQFTDPNGKRMQTEGPVSHRAEKK